MQQHHILRQSFDGADPVLGPAAVCWNILNHLDSGVLSEQYGSLLPKHNDTPTILSRLFPFQVIELGDGFVIGTEKVLTKASGVFKNGAAVGATVFVYEDCFLVATATAGEAAVEGVVIGKGEVRIKLRPTRQALVVWDQPSYEI